MTPANPDDFAAAWCDRLSNGALVLFRHGAPADDAFTHSAIADAFAQSLGLTPIGFNWELLDAQGEVGDTRSALGEMTKALSHDLSNPSTPWLDHSIADRCARDFLALFDASRCTIVSNRYDGLWNPIAGGAVEWGFVGFDQSRIALLLLAAK